MSSVRRVMPAVLNDDTQLFKQSTDNEGFRRCLTCNIFGLTYTLSQVKKQLKVLDRHRATVSTGCDTLNL